MIELFSLLLAVGTASAVFSKRAEFDCSYRDYKGRPHCYLDSLEAPLLPVTLEWLPWQETSVSTCTYACYANNKTFTLAGVGGGDFPSCICGTRGTANFPRTTSSGCNYPCAKSRDENCGGPGMLVSLYEFNCRSNYRGESFSLGSFDVLALLMIIVSLGAAAYVAVFHIVNKKKEGHTIQQVPGVPYVIGAADLLKDGVVFIKNKGSLHKPEETATDKEPKVRRDVNAWVGAAQPGTMEPSADAANYDL